MARDQKPNGNGDHDNRGRFAAGNKAGKGNPHHRRVAELRAKMLERVTPDDVSAVGASMSVNWTWVRAGAPDSAVEALVSKAKAGDTAAIKLLWDRRSGRAT